MKPALPAGTCPLPETTPPALQATRFSISTILLCLWCLCQPWPSWAESGATSLQIHPVQGSFAEVRERLVSAIGNQGFTLSNTLHLHEMLQRTAQDLGMPEDTYLQAEAVEFCSARLAHLMSQAHPGNIANCPFVITLYVLPSQPGVVQVAYRPPLLSGKQAPAVRKTIAAVFAEILAELQF